MMHSLNPSGWHTAIAIVSGASGGLGIVLSYFTWGTMVMSSRRRPIVVMVSINLGLFAICALGLIYT